MMRGGDEEFEQETLLLLVSRHIAMGSILANANYSESSLLLSLRYDSH